MIPVHGVNPYMYMFFPKAETNLAVVPFGVSDYYGVSGQLNTTPSIELQPKFRGNTAVIDRFRSRADRAHVYN